MQILHSNQSSNPSYLLYTSQGFFFRMRIPKALQPIFKKRELKKAIRTTDPVVATRQAIIYAARAFELFDSLQGVSLADYPFHKLETTLQPDGSIKYGFDRDRDVRRQEIEDLQNAGLLPRTIDRNAANPFIPPSSNQTPATPIPASVTPIANVPAPSIEASVEDDGNPFKPRLLLSEAIELYIRDKKSTDGDYDLEKEKAHRSLFKKLIEDITDLPVGKIGYNHASQFRETLKRLPKIQNKGRRSNMTLAQLIEDADKRDADIESLVKIKDQYDEKLYKAKMEELRKYAQRLSANTAGQRMNSISSLFNFLLEKSDGVIKNPFKGVTVKNTQKALNARLPFSLEDLSAIFSDKIWTSEGYKQTWEYWLPLLLLHTGARVNELCQLEKKDVKQTRKGIWCISVNNDPTDEEEDIWDIVKKKIKTESSRRSFPLHPKLIELGFLDFWGNSNDGLLFDITPYGGRLSKYPGKRINDYILPRVKKQTGVDVKNSRKVFYSFRHTTMNELKQSLVHMEIRAQLAGHSTGTTTGDVYGEEYQAHTLLPVLMLLDFSKELKDVKPWVSNPTIPEYFKELKDTDIEVHRNEARPLLPQIITVDAVIDVEPEDLHNTIFQKSLAATKDN